MRIIRGKYGRRRFDVPKNITARPTTDFARENIFNVLENLVDFEGLRALDLFAGTGAVSFEFLSRGCSTVTSIEKAATQHEFIRKVSKILEADNHRIIRGDVLKFLDTAKRGTSQYDVIFADPPYDMENFDEVPVKVLESGILAPGGVFVMEHNSSRDYSALPGYFDHRAYGSVNFSLFRGEKG
ncbi:MAG: 16S rRNA (guanine(966)-N(2))-methyltransferase RsmD [Bacteroidales bacterium]|nr:16S rRNA (guanine(966)-N(2))-methyltransferase RsmD [Bacteroidales bacterium]